MNRYFVTTSGIKIPQLLYGTAWKEQRTADLVELALKKGFRGLDTACQPKHYNEALVGEGLRRCLSMSLKRSDLFLQTKFTPLRGQDPQRVPYDPAASIDQQISQSFSVSQKNLGTKYIDSLVLHSPLESLEETLLAWRALESLVAEKLVGVIGISNCYDFTLLKALYESAQVKPSVLQNRFYKDSGYDRDLRKFCQQQNIYYQCFWTLKANSHILHSGAVQRISKEKNRSEAQVFFRCLNQQQIFPLTGTTSTKHMEEDLAIFDFSLTPQECAEIQATGPY